MAHGARVDAMSLSFRARHLRWDAVTTVLPSLAACFSYPMGGSEWSD
jgi:hypothetical protein